MAYLLLRLVALQAASYARAAPACGSRAFDLGTGGSPFLREWANLDVGELAFSYYKEHDNHYHISCYEVGPTPQAFAAADNGTVIPLKSRVTAELYRHAFGIATKSLTGTYPLASQDSFGQINLLVKEVNGVTIGVDSAATINPMAGSVDCETEATRGVFGHTAKFLTTSTVSSDLSMKTYLFRNAAAFAAARSEIRYTMDVGGSDVGKCALEIEFGVKPKAGTGGVTLEVQIRQHAYVNETGLNSQMSTQNNTNDWSFLLPKDQLLQATGASASEIAAAVGQSVTLMAVAKKFVCGSTGAHVEASFVIIDRTMTITLTPAQAPVSCGTMYWDPLVKPNGCPDGAGCERTFTTPAETSSAVSSFSLQTAFSTLMLAAIVRLSLSSFAGARAVW
ncbi:unnamed protein product [Amoebophrya sp. A120]|nr:unnamed protein product [Amoebophrya sp. A120]|eukprot:GSA120T00022657001.1